MKPGVWQAVPGGAARFLKPPLPSPRLSKACICDLPNLYFWKHVNGSLSKLFVRQKKWGAEPLVDRNYSSEWKQRLNPPMTSKMDETVSKWFTLLSRGKEFHRKQRRWLTRTPRRPPRLKQAFKIKDQLHTMDTIRNKLTWNSKFNKSVLNLVLTTPNVLFFLLDIYF